MNILMLNLSTFPYDAEKKEYKSMVSHPFFYLVPETGEQRSVEGIYQLDPVPNMLFKEGIELDRAIVFSTAKTRIPKEIIADDYADGPISEVEYFLRHLKSIMLQEDTKVEVIDINENQPEEAIDAASRLIESWTANADAHLYIDTHGGFRDTQLIEEAIIKLVTADRLETTVYSVHYEGSGKSFISEDKAIKIFDFVSGMNEFMNYGRIDSLLKYLDFESNRELLKPIIEISEGIQWSNLTSFENGIKHLRNYYKKDKKVDNIYLSMFEGRIRADYGGLLGDSLNGIDMLKWCLKKGFYQQALTVIEARIPYDFFAKEIIKLTEDGQTFALTHNIYQSRNCLTNGDIFNGCLYSFDTKLSWWWNTNGAGGFNSIFKNLPVNLSEYDTKILDILSKRLPENYKMGQDIDYEALLLSFQNVA